MSTSCMYTLMLSYYFYSLCRSDCTTSFSCSKNVFFNTRPSHPSTETKPLLSISFQSIFFLFPSRLLRYIDRTLPKWLHLAPKSDHLYTNWYFNIILLFHRPDSFFLASHSLLFADTHPRSNSSHSSRFPSVLKLERWSLLALHLILKQSFQALFIWIFQIPSGMRTFFLIRKTLSDERYGVLGLISKWCVRGQTKHLSHVVLRHRITNWAMLIACFLHKVPISSPIVVMFIQQQTLYYIERLMLVETT